VRELSAQPQEGREGQGTATKQGLAWQPFPALPSAPSVEPRVHINDIFTYVRNCLHFENVLNSGNIPFCSIFVQVVQEYERAVIFRQV
jgi:hypothetical protein